jgi:hypothetical protein
MANDRRAAHIATRLEFPAANPLGCDAARYGDDEDGGHKRTRPKGRFIIKKRSR